MSIKALILVIIAIFGVSLTVVAMGDAGIALENASWSTIGPSVAYFTIMLAAVAVILFMVKRNG